MDVKLENGGVEYSVSGTPIYIDSIDEIVQRIELSCCMKKGDFPLCKNLGCYFQGLSTDDIQKEKLTMIFREATMNIPYSNLEVVECSKNDSKILAKIKVSYGLKTAYTEVSVNV